MLHCSVTQELDEIQLKCEHRRERTYRKNVHQTAPRSHELNARPGDVLGHDEVRIALVLDVDVVSNGQDRRARPPGMRVLRQREGGDRRKRLRPGEETGYSQANVLRKVLWLLQEVAQKSAGRLALVLAMLRDRAGVELVVGHFAAVPPGVAILSSTHRPFVSAEIIVHD